MTNNSSQRRLVWKWRSDGALGPYDSDTRWFISAHAAYVCADRSYSVLSFALDKVPTETPCHRLQSFPGTHDLAVALDVDGCTWADGDAMSEGVDVPCKDCVDRHLREGTLVVQGGDILHLDPAFLRRLAVRLLRHWNIIRPEDTVLGEDWKTFQEEEP